MTKTRYKASSKTRLADAYAISTHTLNKWLSPIQKDLGGYVGQIYNPKQVAFIVKHLGEPEKMEHISV